MDLLRSVIDLFLHLDQHLGRVLAEYGVWTYAILSAIVFCETGLVVTPFLPGDSLLFAAGTFAALGSLDVRIVMALLFVAALLGDNVNYWFGRYVGPRALSGQHRFLRREYLDRTSAFYAKHGGKTIVMARFIPIIRTFAPFVAGVGAMRYPTFLAYSVAGAALWVGLFVLGGFYFGNIPVVRNNFTLVILAIIAVSVLPVVLEALKNRGSAKRAGPVSPRPDPAP
ncbi:MAG: DedA family protein [Gemmatimonadales bacterium]|nr:DedA family protein [Gemmatimonadales bacterium]